MHDKMYYAYRIQGLTRKLSHHTLSKANISFILHEEIVRGNWEQISLTGLANICSELERVGYKVLNPII